MKQELIMLRGLPFSGKTDWATAWVAEDFDSRTRFSLDEFRFFRDETWHPDHSTGESRGREKETQHAAWKIIQQLLEAGDSVVLDSTNLEHRIWTKANRLVAQLSHLDVKLSSRDFHPAFAETEERNAARPKHLQIPTPALRRIRNQLGPEEQLPHLDGSHPTRPFMEPETRAHAILVDLDGTLVDIRPVKRFLAGSVRNFDRFHRDSLWCKPNPRILQQVRTAQAAGLQIVITTAREERYREVSQLWLERHNIPFSNMFMRKNGDPRIDYEVKKEMLESRVLPHYDPVRCFDDNPYAIQAWEEAGLVVTTVPFLPVEVDDLTTELDLQHPAFLPQVCLRCDGPAPAGELFDTECAAVR